jgi:hypothetical protein
MAQDDSGLDMTENDSGMEMACFGSELDKRI